jgi:hypothetical protein
MTKNEYFLRERAVRKEYLPPVIFSEPHSDEIRFERSCG